MLIKIIAVGKVKDRNLAALCDEMLKRIRFGAKIEVLELKDGGKQSDNRRILDQLNKEKGCVIALSEDGETTGSENFAAKLDSIQRKLVFVLGGALGLDDAVKCRADLILSLSPMTFTHEMARYILLEQVFRAITIIKGRGYHNA